MGNKSGYTSSGNSGPAKAVKFTETIQQHGWECKTHYDEATQTTHLFARREDKETIDVWWIGPKGALTKEKLPLYKLAGETIKCINVSAVLNIASKEADLSRLGKAVKRSTRRKVNLVVSSENEAVAATYSGEAIQAARDALAPTLDGSYAELRERLEGTVIQWVNTQSKMTEEAIVSRVKSVTRNGHDYITFTNKEGFHSVYLDSIVGIK